jgi:hypothetical protein
MAEPSEPSAVRDETPNPRGPDAPGQIFDPGSAAESDRGADGTPGSDAGTQAPGATPGPKEHDLEGHITVNVGGSPVPFRVGIDRAAAPGETPTAPAAEIATLRNAVEHGVFPAHPSTLLVRDVLRVLQNRYTTLTSPTAELCDAVQCLRTLSTRWLGRRR